MRITQLRTLTLVLLPCRDQEAVLYTNEENRVGASPPDSHRCTLAKKTDLVQFHNIAYTIHVSSVRSDGSEAAEAKAQEVSGPGNQTCAVQILELR